MNTLLVSEAMLAMAFLGTMNFLIVSQIKKGASVQMAMAFVAAVLLPFFVIWTWKKGIQLPVTKNMILLLLSAGLLSAVGNWLALDAAAKASNGGIIFAIVGCQVAVLTILAWYFLGDQLTAVQIVGILACLVGIVIINMGA